MEQKDDILKYILNTKNIDKGTVKKMVKGKKLNLWFTYYLFIVIILRKKRLLSNYIFIKML